MIETVATDRGPKAIGPYSQAVKANGFLFVSGQIAFDPRTQQLVDGVGYQGGVLNQFLALIGVLSEHLSRPSDQPVARTTVQCMRADPSGKSDRPRQALTANTACLRCLPGPTA